MESLIVNKTVTERSRDVQCNASLRRRLLLAEGGGAELRHYVEWSTLEGD